MEPSIDKPQINPSKYNKFDFILYLTKKEDRKRQPDKHKNLPFHFLIFFSFEKHSFLTGKHGKKYVVPTISNRLVFKLLLYLGLIVPNIKFQKRKKGE